MSVLSESAALQSMSPAPPIEPSLAEASDYFALMKPRVMSLVVFTAFVGMMVAPSDIV